MAVFQRLAGAANCNVIRNDLAAACGALENGKHLAELVVAKLLNTYQNSGAGKREDQGNFCGLMQENQTHEAEPGGNGVEKKYRFAL